MKFILIFTLVFNHPTLFYIILYYREKNSQLVFTLLKIIRFPQVHADQCHQLQLRQTLSR